MWEIVKPFIVNGLATIFTVLILIVVLHLPNVLSLFGLKAGP